MSNPSILSIALFNTGLHPTLNKNINLTKLTTGSDKKLWWIGVCGHEWERAVHAYASNQTCPYCVGRKVLVDFNDLGSTCPLIASEWHFAKNAPLVPQEVSGGSNKKVWWLGECGHEWEARIGDRKTGTGCPVCAGKQVLVGFNDLATTHPIFSKEFHPTKNGNLTQQEITAGSNKKVWWKCSKGHEWEAPVCDRTRETRSTGCPYCSNRRIIKNANDLATAYPEISRQWHPTKNGLLTPTNVSPKSGQRIWWLCSKGHEWETIIADRTTYTSGCPFCCNSKILAGFNDFSTTHPYLLKEWHPTKNEGIDPKEIIAGSNKKIWWQCSKGHEWEARPNDRAYSFNGCPKCNPTISKAEQFLFDYFNLLGTKVIQSDKTILKGKELDLYFPDKNIAIEYNGLYWHSEEQGKDKTYHYNKWLECKNQGVQLIQIWEDDWNDNSLLIKNMLDHKLGKSKEPRIYARQTQVVKLSTTQARNFLNTYHLQGFASGSYYLGLQSKVTQNLVAVLVLKKEAGAEGKVLNIIRYATAVNVVGGFTKLLSYAEKTYLPDSFITFSDHCVSDGGLYENNGFTADKEIAPDYMYVIKKKRKHKFGYRLKRFETDPDLLWDSSLTELELAKLNNLPRIWDAGKTRWIKTVKN